MSKPKLTIEEKAHRGKDIARSRYERHVLEGIPLEDIAKMDGVSTACVSRHVEHYRRFRDMCNLQELEGSQIDTLLSLQGKERAALEDMLTATTIVGGAKTAIPDYEVRKNALKLINDKIEAIKPNGRGITVQTAVMGNSQETQQTVTVTEGGRDFESIVRKVRQSRRAQLAGPPERALPEGTVLEGEVVQAPTEPPSADSPAQG